MNGDKWKAAVGHARVRLRWGGGLGEIGEGRLLSYSIGPMVLVETDDGERIWWRSSLAEITDPEAFKDETLKDHTP